MRSLALQLLASAAGLIALHTPGAGALPATVTDIHGGSTMTCSALQHDVVIGEWAYSHGQANDDAECCGRCTADTVCAAFTFEQKDSAEGSCFLKNSTSYVRDWVQFTRLHTHS